jgi:branched-chain amino acid transport system ATP-binding protein
MANYLLEAHNLRKEFGGLIAVDDVSIQVEAGITHSIIGPNGAGKTTFFNLLSGIYAPTHGQVIFNGQDITQLPIHRRAHMGMGRSFQITNIFPMLTVLENVRLACQAMSEVNFHFWQRADSYTGFIERAMEIIELVGLRADAAKAANVLPHGGKRKLELAIILAGEPTLLLLDEPTAGMASEQVPELMATIEAIQGEGNKTIILVEHNMNVVMSASNKITVMNQGKLLAEGTPEEIAANDTVQKVYLGELYEL